MRFGTLCGIYGFSLAVKSDKMTSRFSKRRLSFNLCCSDVDNADRQRVALRLTWAKCGGKTGRFCRREKEAFVVLQRSLSCN